MLGFIKKLFGMGQGATPIDLAKEQTNPKLRKAFSDAASQGDSSAYTETNPTPDPEPTSSSDYEPSCYRDGGF